MKQLLIILFTTTVFMSNKRELFYSREEKCSLYFMIITEFQLELRENGLFVLNIQTSDSRYKDIQRKGLQGSFQYKNDTLLLKVNDELPKSYYPNQVSYLLMGDSLVIQNRDFTFPQTLKKTTVPLVGQ